MLNIQQQRLNISLHKTSAGACTSDIDGSLPLHGRAGRLFMKPVVRMYGQIKYRCAHYARLFIYYYIHTALKFDLHTLFWFCNREKRISRSPPHGFGPGPGRCRVCHQCSHGLIAHGSCSSRSPPPRARRACRAWLAHPRRMTMKHPITSGASIAQTCQLSLSPSLSHHTPQSLRSGANLNQQCASPTHIR